MNATIKIKDISGNTDCENEYPYRRDHVSEDLEKALRQEFPDCGINVDMGDHTATLSNCADDSDPIVFAFEISCGK